MAKKEKEVTTEHYLDVPAVDVDVDAPQEDLTAEDKERVAIAPVDEGCETIEGRIARYEAELEKTEKKTPQEIQLRAAIAELQWVKSL